MSQTETTEPTASTDSDTEPAAFAMASVPGMPFATTTGLRVRPDLYDDDYSDDQYEEMLELYEGTMSQIAEGEIVKSKVLRVTENAVILDVGFKSEGSVPLDEFKDPQNLQVGDEVEVFLEHLEDQEGAVVLSKKKADFMRVWEKIRQAHENDQPVEGTLMKKIKGGVVVNLMGVDAFLPGSQIALRRVPNIDELLGQTYEFKIIKLNKRRRNIVVSRRVILETERAGKREKLMKELEAGQVRKGVVKNITDFGAFIDLGGVDGLLHITDMSYGRVSHPSELVAIGKEVDVKILDIDWQRERISLGMKQLQSYPWQNVSEKYPVGARVQGKVVSITNYGAFVELEPGIEGLVHISEMSWTRNVRHPSKIVSIGETIEAVVLKVDESEEKISLGMKQLQSYPWQNVSEKYPVGARVQGKVVSITNYGAFVELEPGIEGLVHISEMSWTRNVRHPSKIVSIGETIEAVVLKVDESEEKISLGMKQTEQDPWMVLPLKYPVGTRITGKVRNLTSFGAFVEIEPGIDGLIHISDMSWTKRVQHPSEVVKKGDTVDVIILNIDSDNKRISLGLKQATDDPWLTIGETLPVGSERRAKVLRPVDKGIVVDLGDDIEGFAPVSQMGLAPDQDPEQAVVEGQTIVARVLEVDPIHHRVVVAIVDYPEDGIPTPEEIAAAKAAAEERAAAMKAAESEADDEIDG